MNFWIGVCRNQVVEILTNQISGWTTPSIVSFSSKEKSVSDQTQNKISNDHDKIIYSVNRIIGEKDSNPGFNNSIYNLASKLK